jgi:antitoxin HicB
MTYEPPHFDFPYKIRPLSAEEGGGWLVEFPDLPGCLADGETPEEALYEAADAVRSWIETARAHGDPIPVPSWDRRFDGGISA